VYALQGRTEEAEALFERLLGLRNGLACWPRSTTRSRTAHRQLSAGLLPPDADPDGDLLQSGTAKRSRAWTPPHSPVNRV
jgi:hypothetical protein